jgi:hypothetical protein
VRTVRGNGFAVSIPAGWQVTQSPLGLSASASKGSDTTVSVTIFRLVRPYRPALWKRASAELDGIANLLARRLGGGVEARKTVRVGSARARQYELSYEHEGTALRERITFVLRGLREYELLCRWRKADGEPQACGQLLASFTL